MWYIAYYHKCGSGKPIMAVQPLHKHNRSLKVTVQGLDFMAHSLYIYTTTTFTEQESLYKLKIKTSH
jgi:hypothetical protein